jgi:hypothetical protein
MISFIHDWLSILFLWPGTNVWARHLWLAGTNWTFFRGLFLFMFSSGFGLLPYSTLIGEVWEYELYYSSRDTIHPKETSDSCAVRITYRIRWKRETCISVTWYTIPYIKDNLILVMVFNTTSNNIAFLSWRSVFMVEETGVTGENHQFVANHWQTLWHNVVSSTPRLSGTWTHNVIGDRHWLHK